MLHLRELISLLCLVLLVWTLFAPGSGPDILLVLPVVGFLYIVATAVPIPGRRERKFRILDPSLSSISLRAPPVQ